MDDWLDTWDGPDTVENDNKKDSDDENGHSEVQEIDICPRLWIGGVSAAKDQQWLKSHGITHILITGAMLQQFYPGEYEYKTITCLDTDKQDILSYFPDCIDFIHRGRQAGSVLVHCQYGVSRSAAFCIAYVMADLQISFEQAYDHVYLARPYVDPNMGFISQLKLFESMGLKIDPKDERYKKFRRNTLM